MPIPSTSPRYRTLIAAASLIVGPLVMAIGDLLHPKESIAPPEQIAILVDHASRWYTAHLLLFVGLMLFIPGLLALVALTEWTGFASGDVLNRAGGMIGAAAARTELRG